MAYDAMLWSATAMSLALFAVLSTVALVMRTTPTLLWALSFLAVLLRTLLAHAAPYLQHFGAAKPLAWLLSGIATLLYAMGTLALGGRSRVARTLPYAVTGLTASLLLVIFQASPALAVLPLEWTAAGFALAAAGDERANAPLLRIGLSLLALRAAIHPFLYYFRATDGMVYPVSLLVWLAAASAGLASILTDLKRSRDS